METIIVSKTDVALIVKNRNNWWRILCAIDDNQTGRESDNGLTIKVNNTGWADSHKAIAEIMRVLRHTKAKKMTGEYGMMLRDESGNILPEALERCMLPMLSRKGPRYWRQLRGMSYDSITGDLL